MDTQESMSSQQPASDPTPAGRPRMGEEKRQAVRLTLPPSEVVALRKLGNGSASAGVSWLLAQRRDQQTMVDKTSPK